MTNDKAQISNIHKIIRKILHLLIRSSFLIIWIFTFEIHLTFACLREAASAKAGILKFGI
jgi:hypothetical protein